MNIQYGITDKEIEAARFCIACASSLGAEGARVSLSKNVLDTVALLNGDIDKVTHCADRSIYLYLYIDGKYGTYSTNLLENEQLEDFVRRAVDATRMLTRDEFRKLPEASRCERNAVDGLELGLYDPAYAGITPRQRTEMAMAGSIFPGDDVRKNVPGDATDDARDDTSYDARDDARVTDAAPYRIISEECEWNDSVDDNYLIDSQGFEGRHTETSFSFWTEVTICAEDGKKYSGYSWKASTRLKDVSAEGCSQEALEKAIAQMNPKRVRSGKKTMVVDCNASSRLVSPLLSALSASAIQQKNSFLEGCLGKKVFSQDFYLDDLARTPGKAGSRLFDTEGVATADRVVIEGGVVRMFFVNTYMAGKTGLEPTIEGVSRPVVRPFSSFGKSSVPDHSHNIPDTDTKVIPASARTNPDTQVIPNLSREEIMLQCGEGILVTGFNGGNCNQTTGDFSYGVEGFLFSKGKIIHPVREMVITGNMTELWNSLLAAGDDPREGTRWQIPTLAFKDVTFNS